MRYSPVFTEKEIEENRLLAGQRRDFFMNRGLDFMKGRDFILQRSGPFSGRILEVGSGRGNTALFLARNGYIFTTIDNNQEMLKCAALNLAGEGFLDKSELILMDAYEMGFDPESFDTVLMVEALHHIDDTGALCGEIDRVLSPGGKVVLADFNEKGMGIVDGVHRHEGRTHQSYPFGKIEAETWFFGHGYSLESFEDDCHWLVTGIKKEEK
jgi:ubiquinone/menaquinone biosynthesis C-methylase UbiE